MIKTKLSTIVYVETTAKKIAEIAPHAHMTGKGQCLVSASNLEDFRRTGEEFTLFNLASKIIQYYPNTDVIFHTAQRT